jgi:hypothetical protein
MAAEQVCGGVPHRGEHRGVRIRRHIEAAAVFSTAQSHKQGIGCISVLVLETKASLVLNNDPDQNASGISRSDEADIPLILA